MAHRGSRGAGMAALARPRAGHQRPGVAARRVPRGQAPGMKEALSSGDTAAASPGPPPAALIGAGC